MSNCHEEIVCRDCKEWTTRHEPCCPGTPTCECIECKGCSELFPDENLRDGRCKECLEGLREDKADADAEDRWLRKREVV